MNDLEICKRIAEIEGIVNPSCDGHNIYINVGDEDMPVRERYNPLTDDALLWRLAKKYRVSLEYFAEWQRQQAESDVIAHIEIGEGIWCAGSAYFRDGDKSINKAILLVIIEAHNER